MVKIKYKPLIGIGIGLVFFICITSFFIFRSNIDSKNFNDFIDKDTNISKIMMMSGNTGKSMSTINKIKIKELVRILNNTHYSKSSSQINRIGFSYSYTFYVGDKPVLHMFNIGNTVSEHNTYYDTTIETRDGIKSWYNSLPLQGYKSYLMP